MSIQTITINENKKHSSPKVRLAEVSDTDIWHYIGNSINFSGYEHDNNVSDVNRVVEQAAQRLADKVASRNVLVEVLINPVIPPVHIAASKMIPLIVKLGENASAAVEPGPGYIQMKTWWMDDRVGVDVIAQDGILPEVIEAQIMQPGFSTSVGEWDTGFGLHEVQQSVKELHGSVECVNHDEEDNVRFRLSLPLIVATSPGSPEAELEVPIPVPSNEAYTPQIGLYFPELDNDAMEVNCYGNGSGQCRA